MGYNNKEVVAVYTISNTGGLAIYEIDDADDRILVGLNDEKPEWCELRFDIPGDVEEDDYEDEDEVSPYFYWGEMSVPLSQCMRV